MLDHYIKQPLSWHYVNWTVRRPISSFIYQWRRLRVTSRGQLPSLVYEASLSKQIHLRKLILLSECVWLYLPYVWVRAFVCVHVCVCVRAFVCMCVYVSKHFRYWQNDIKIHIYILAPAWQNQQTDTCAQRRLFAVRMNKAWVLSYAQRRLYRTGRMPRLI